MALGNFRIEAGLEILTTNSDAGIWIIQGAGAPPGTSGPSDDATVGSVWHVNDGTGLMYRKVASTSSATDWLRFTDESVYTLIGTAFGATDLGTFTGTVITDNVAVKVALQELETYVEGLSVSPTGSVAVAAATPTTIDTCLVDSCCSSEWEICVFETASEDNKEFFKLTALHDGETGADATSIDWSTHTKLKIGNIGGLTFQPVLAGAAAAQTMGLEISATAAITVKFRRSDVPN